jgi:hypothetical protein
MGYEKNWDIGSIVYQIHAVRSACTNSYSDRLASFRAKQDLYQIKWIIDEALKECPSFAEEDAWLKDQEKKKERKKILRILKT